MTNERSPVSLLERREGLLGTVANQQTRIRRLDRLVLGKLETGPIARGLKYGLVKEQVRDREIDAEQRLSEIDGELARQEAEQALTDIRVDRDNRNWAFPDEPPVTFRSLLNWKIASHFEQHARTAVNPYTLEELAREAGFIGIPASHLVGNIQTIIENDPLNPEILVSVKEKNELMGWILKARISYAGEVQQPEQITPHVEAPVEHREQEQRRPVIMLDQGARTIQVNDHMPRYLKGNINWELLISYALAEAPVRTISEILAVAKDAGSTEDNIGTHTNNLDRTIRRSAPSDLATYEFVKKVKTESGETAYEIQADIVFIPDLMAFLSETMTPDVIRDLLAHGAAPTAGDVFVVPPVAEPVTPTPPRHYEEEKTEADMEREKAALVASLMQSRVGTSIRLTEGREMKFSLTPEMDKLFEAMEVGIRIRNGSGQYLTPLEMKAKRHEAVVWLESIYDQYRTSDYSHPNEHVDNLIVAMHEMDESAMGGHLLLFLLAEPTKKVVTDRTYQQPKTVWEWHAPAEMVRNIQAREAAERQRVQQQPIEAETVVDFQPSNVPQSPDLTGEFSPKPGTAIVCVDPATYDYMSDPEALARIAALSANRSTDVFEATVIHTNAAVLEDLEIPERVRRKLLERDSEIETRLQKDLEIVLNNITAFPASPVQISTGLNLHIRIVNKIIDALGIKSLQKRGIKVDDDLGRIPFYDEVGALLVQYGRKYFGMKKTTTFLPDEVESLKHWAIKIHKAYQKTLEETAEVKGHGRNGRT